MQLQKEHNIHIYHCNQSGSFLSALYVGNDKNKWKFDRECIGRGFTRVYCKSDFTGGAFEVGDIFYSVIDGLLFRKE
jgi:hypothetical protein